MGIARGIARGTTANDRAGTTLDVVPAVTDLPAPALRGGIYLEAGEAEPCPARVLPVSCPCPARVLPVSCHATHATAASDWADADGPARDPGRDARVTSRSVLWCARAEASARASWWCAATGDPDPRGAIHRAV